MSVTILRQSTRIGDTLPVKEYPGQVNKSTCFQQSVIYVTDDQNRLPAIAGTRGDAVMPAGAGNCGERVKADFLRRPANSYKTPAKPQMYANTHTHIQTFKV